MFEISEKYEPRDVDSHFELALTKVIGIMNLKYYNLSVFFGTLGTAIEQAGTEVCRRYRQSDHKRTIGNE